MQTNGVNVDREAQTGGTVEADLNKWLPVTASRKAKWWYSAFHNVTAMVGAGVLGLPFAISQLGWYIRFLSILLILLMIDILINMEED